MEQAQTQLALQKEPLFSNRMLTRLIIPLVVEQFLAMTVGVADTVMITSVGEAAVSGVALVDTINNLVIQILAALATGGAVVASQYLGRQERQNARMAAKQLVYTVTLFSTLLMAIALVFCQPLLRFIFGSIEEEVMQNAQTYFWICALSYPALAIYNGIAALYRSMGNSKISMLTSLLMNIINIGGNAILIYIFNWGAAGAATASLVSRVVSAVVMLVLIRDHHNVIFLDKLLKFEYRPQMVKSILKIGIPNGLENGMFQIGKLTVQSLISTFGTAAIAANAIVNSISNLVMVPGSAVGLGIITVVGQCVGAKDYDQATGYAKRLIKMSYLSMALLNLCLFFLGPVLMPLFDLSPSATDLAIRIIHVLAIFNATVWTLSFPFANILRASGDAKYTMIVSVISMWVFRIGLSYILAKNMNLELMGVWYAMFVDWVVRAICFFIRFKSGKWKTKTVI